MNLPSPVCVVVGRVPLSQLHLSSPSVTDAAFHFGGLQWIGPAISATWRQRNGEEMPVFSATEPWPLLPIIEGCIPQLLGFKSEWSTSSCCRCTYDGCLTSCSQLLCMVGRTLVLLHPHPVLAELKMDKLSKLKLPYSVSRSGALESTNVGAGNPSPFPGLHLPSIFSHLLSSISFLYFPVSQYSFFYLDISQPLNPSYPCLTTYPSCPRT